MAIKRRFLIWVGLGMALAVSAGAQNRAPQIQHTPARVAVRGQPLLLRAVVSDDAGRVKAVNIFYSTSPDTAPFKVPMQAAGAGAYSGSIAEGLFSGAEKLSYYIAAEDAQGANSETPWYTVPIRALQASDAEAAAGSRGAGGREPRAKWVTPALIAGGAAVVVGGAVALANRDGGGGSSDDDIPAGTFAGTATTYLQMDGSNTTWASKAITITINDNGTVVSDSLPAGGSQSVSLSGNSFIMSSQIAETNLTGDIQYVGTVVSDRIVGFIQGTAQSAAGSSGTFSGSFSATRQ